MKVKRFGVSLEEDLLDKLDSYVVSNHFPNRSQAIRHLIQKTDVEKKWEENEIVAGAIVLVYDHHKRDLQTQSTSLQHDYHDLIISVQHVHLNHDNCLETITVKGKAGKLRDLADRLIALKGIKHGELVMSTP
jgi:CopG family nickel-responsive transcriptional regulator